MKRLALIIPIVLALLLPLNAAAESGEDYIMDFNGALPEDMQDTLDGAEKIIDAVGFKSIIVEIAGILEEEGRGIFGFLLTLIALSIALSLAACVDMRMRHIAVSASSVICAVLVFERMHPAVRAVGEALSDASEFFGRLIPILTGISAAGGGVNAATVGATGMSLTLGVIGAFSTEVLTYAVSALFVLGMIADLDSIGAGLAGAVRSFLLWGLGIVTFLLGATVALQTVIASAGDGMLMRTARYAASGSIPLVGGAVSGALSTLAAGLSYAKGVIGGGSVAALVGIVSAPLVLLFAYRFVLSLTVSFLDFIGAGGGVRCFKAMLGALDALIAILSMSIIVYIFEIIVFIKSGVAIL